MITKTQVNSNIVISNTLLMSKFIQGPSPEIYLVYLKVDSNLQFTKHTRCHYFTLSQPGNSHLSKMAAGDAVIDMTAWECYRLKKNMFTLFINNQSPY